MIVSTQKTAKRNSVKQRISKKIFGARLLLRMRDRATLTTTQTTGSQTGDEAGKWIPGQGLYAET
jgi:hypothetical protein